MISRWPNSFHHEVFLVFETVVLMGGNISFISGLSTRECQECAGVSGKDEWHGTILSSVQYQVTRGHATERAWAGKYNEDTCVWPQYLSWVLGVWVIPWTTHCSASIMRPGQCTKSTTARSRIPGRISSCTTSALALRSWLWRRTTGSMFAVSRIKMCLYITWQEN